MKALPAIVLLIVTRALVSGEPSLDGTPACNDRGEQLADREYFLVCYNSERRGPTWVGYTLTPEQLVKNASRRSSFRADSGIAVPVATNNDFRYSGFHRGHLAPAADFSWSEDAIRSTFLLTNVVPQHPAANLGPWAKLEARIRTIAAEADTVTVISGAIFDCMDCDAIGANRVAVPTHLFKVVLVSRAGVRSMHAAIVPNLGQSESLTLCFTSVAEVERRTNLDFFSALDDSEESALEARVSPL